VHSQFGTKRPSVQIRPPGLGGIHTSPASMFTFGSDDLNAHQAAAIAAPMSVFGSEMGADLERI
jgi:hypothetical protein